MPLIIILTLVFFPRFTVGLTIWLFVKLLKEMNR